MILGLFSCIKENVKPCPYDYTLYLPNHFLRIPVTISPHKMVYKVGDTMRISTIFSDSIYDMGTRHTFKIQNFPFKPLSLLYRITSGTTHDSGYRINKLTIDSIYQSKYKYSTIYTDLYTAKTVYKDNVYKFESELILKEPGKYIFLMSDLYQEYNGSGNSDLNAEADAITFDGKCYEYYLCYMIDSGDTHLKSFQNELIYLDKNVYMDKLVSRENHDFSAPLGDGVLQIEFNGYYGFEVVE